jgi:hypothetical protein
VSGELPMGSRRLLVVWHCSLLGGILPILVLGFIYSALADRLMFVGWALALATVYTIVLRQGLALGWRPPLLAGVLGLLLGAGFAWLAGIEQTHHEILDLGFRAVFPALYHPLATRPSSAGVLAAALAAGGAGALAFARLRPAQTARTAQPAQTAQTAQSGQRGERAEPDERGNGEEPA